MNLLRLWPHKHVWVTVKCDQDIRPRTHNGKNFNCTKCARCWKHLGAHGIAGWYGRFQ